MTYKLHLNQPQTPELDNIGQSAWLAGALGCQVGMGLTDTP